MDGVVFLSSQKQVANRFSLVCMDLEVGSGSWCCVSRAGSSVFGWLEVYLYFRWLKVWLWRSRPCLVAFAGSLGWVGRSVYFFSIEFVSVFAGKGIF